MSSVKPRTENFTRLPRNLKPLALDNVRKFDHPAIPQSWNAFQRLRLGDNAMRWEQDCRVPVAEKATSNERQASSDIPTASSGIPKPPSHRAPSQKHSSNTCRWARSWANCRAHQALLTRNSFEKSKTIPRSTSDSFSKRDRLKTHSSSRGSRLVELDPKSAAAFGRLRSIYVNDVERIRRLQSIKSRMNDIQRQSIHDEVKKRLQLFNSQLKEDEKNRRELRRLRDKFTETKRNRLKHMHVSRNALDVPSVSRMAYGLPREGKEFSASFSSKKTTDEIKNMWRMAIVRRNCIDNFLSKISGSMHHELPDITIKSRNNSPTKTVSDPRLSAAHLSRLAEKDEETTGNDIQINHLPELQRGISELLTESISSEDDDDDISRKM